jgi:glycosyltransferase involved in cell wall biosynthesis
MSHCVPPVPYGPSFVLKRLFSRFPKGSYAVYTTYYDKTSGEPLNKLECNYHYAPARTIFTDYSKWALIREWLEVLPMIWRGLKVIKEEKIDALLVCPTSGNFLLAAYIMHKAAGIPISIYLLDNFVEAQTLRLRKYFSKPIEKAALRAASNVFVMSEALQEYYYAKYGIRSILLPHSIDLEEFNKQASEKKIENDGKKKRIVFTGMIYEAQFDAIKNLVNALEGLPRVEFHTYTQRSANRLISMGLSGNNIFHHSFVDPKSAMQIQREADLLFLPMAFNSPYPEIIKTASPSKLPEYLASGTPIVVHAPKYAYIAKYAREKGWGAIVDEPNTKLLRETVLNVLSDENYRMTLVKHAKMAVVAHDSGIVSKTLKKAMGIDE